MTRPKITGEKNSVEVKEVKEFLAELKKSNLEFDVNAYIKLHNYFASFKNTKPLNEVNLLILCIFLNKRFLDDINHCHKNTADGVNKQCLEFAKKLANSYKNTPLQYLLSDADSHKRFPVIKDKPVPRIRFSTAFLLYDFACQVLVQPTPQRSRVQRYLNVLCKSILKLDPREFDNLMQQQLRTDSTCYFVDWIREAALHPDGILMQMHGFLQLIIDYMPLLRMSTYVERTYALDYRREHSLKHCDNPPEDEAGKASLNRRIKQLFMAMLFGPLRFGPFPSENAETITVWDKVYTLPQKIYELYLNLVLVINKNKRGNLKLTFSNIERTSHSLPDYPVLLALYYIFCPDGHKKIVSWLQQFHSGVFYDLTKNPWFDERILLHGIFEYARTNRAFEIQLTTLMDTFCHTVCNDTHIVSDHYIEPRLNILFREYITHLHDKNQNKFINFLIEKSEQPVENRESEQPVENRESWLKQFFLWRLAKLTPYNPRMNSHRSRSKSLSELSVKNIESLWENEEYCAGNRIDLLKKALSDSKELTSERSKYLDTLSCPILLSKKKKIIILS